MLFLASLGRAKSLTRFALAATIICLTLTASPLIHAAPIEETAQVFAGDCRTPQTVFYLGDTVCVRVGDFPLHPTSAEYYRRINWSAPNLAVAETEVVGADPEYDKFDIPTTGDFALPGKWRVQAVDIETNTRTVANFTVRHPRYFYVDLHAWKYGPDFVLPGDKVRYLLTFRNSGPEFADVVQFAEDVPSNATFLALRQRTGSPFECQLPKEGDVGRIICSGRGLKPEEEATFDVYYTINREAREGDTCEGRTQIVSQTNELNKYDNIARYSSIIAGPYTGEPEPREEQENQTGGDPPKDVPEPEKVNSPDYKGDKVIWPEPEKVNPPDYKGDEVIWPDPEIENP